MINQQKNVTHDISENWRILEQQKSRHFQYILANHCLIVARYILVDVKQFIINDQPQVTPEYAKPITNNPSMWLSAAGCLGHSHGCFHKLGMFGVATGTPLAIDEWWCPNQSFTML